jgi:uncharacterized protein
VCGATRLSISLGDLALSAHAIMTTNFEGDDMQQTDQSGNLSKPHEINQFPRAIEEHENVWIPLADGIRLAARIWRPVDADASPVPAILEYLPYRKRDGTATRDALTHPYFAGHGYACIRVDMRGSGESDGLLHGEYLKQEQDDALEVIEWLTQQSWCSGQVGMIGISWGGFNGLQVAYRGHEALRAVITLCSTDDRYADDIHYRGGALLNENQGWAGTMFAYQSRPPDEALVEDWRTAWLERLENTPFLVHDWLKHQHRDEFWQHGSICEDFSKVQAAVLTVGGWGDAYSNAVPRLLRSLDGRTRAIIGPWVHKYPHFAVPQPAIGFLQEALRWWDRWLKDEPTDVETDARMRVYLMDSVRPQGWYASRPGQWYALQTWPSAADDTALNLCLAPGRLGTSAATGESVEVSSPLSVGIASGEYCAIWLGPEMPTDQRVDDGGSTLFDGEILPHDVAIVGAPVLEVELSADAPVAQIIVRLCDVWPDGASTRITYAVLNLTHRDSHETPTPMVPGERYRVRVQLDDVAYKVPAGHRLRLGVSNAYWPLIWPSPTNAGLRLYLDEATLALPLLPADATAPKPFDQPVSAPALQERMMREDSHVRDVTTDLATGVQTMRIIDDFGARVIEPFGLITETVSRETYTANIHDPTSARCDTHWTEVVARDEWKIRTETTIEQTCDATHFHLKGRLEAYEGESLCFERDWSESVPRDLV